MMLVQWDRNEPREVGTVDIEELDTLLDRLDAESREQILPYAVTLWTGPHPDGDDGYALTFTIGTETSPVQWTAPGPPYSRDSWNGGTAYGPCSRPTTAENEPNSTPGCPYRSSTPGKPPACSTPTAAPARTTSLGPPEPTART